MLEIEPAANGYEEGLTAGQQVAGSWRPSRLTQPEKWREAVTESPAGRNLEKALDNLSKWTRIEKSKYQYAVRTSDRDFLISSYGGCDDEGLRRLCDTKTRIFKYYERRLAVMKQILAEAAADGGIDGDVFWRAMLHHDENAPGCQHRDNMPEGVALFTHVAGYTLPAEGRSFRRVIARENGEVLYPCSVESIEPREED